MRYTLGIDGGGTKTEAVIIDEQGKVLGRGDGGGSNTSFVTRRTAAASFRRAIMEALKAVSVRPDEIGCAGYTFGDVADEVFAELGITAPARRYAEQQVAFERAGIRDMRGVALVAGTGSSCAGYDGDCRFSAGGWGALLGDEGSAYDIGLRGIRRALAASEGRLPRTALTRAVEDYFGIESAREVVRKLTGTHIKQALVAGFAERVSEAALNGDAAAVEIMEAAGEDLGELAAFVARHVFEPEDEFPVVLAGGVFNAGRLVTDSIRCVVGPQFPRAKIVVGTMSPGEAVARLALRDCLRGD